MAGECDAVPYHKCITNITTQVHWWDAVFCLKKTYTQAQTRWRHDCSSPVFIFFFTFLITVSRCSLSLTLCDMSTCTWKCQHSLLRYMIEMKNLVESSWKLLNNIRALYGYLLPWATSNFSHSLQIVTVNIIRCKSQNGVDDHFDLPTGSHTWLFGRNKSLTWCYPLWVMQTYISDEFLS